MTKILRNIEEIHSLFSSYFKNDDQCLVGIEQESFIFDCSQKTPKRVDFAFLKALFQQKEQNGWTWDPIAEFKEHVELLKDGRNLSLERGGQFEYSSKPYKTIHELAHAYTQDYAEFKHALPQNYFLCALGFDPITKIDNIPTISKQRYDYMESYLGYWGRTMLRGTCALQVSFDYKSEIDLMKKLTVVTTFQPLISSLLLSSPIAEGEGSIHESYRCHIWNQVDGNRSGACFAMNQPQSLESYLDKILKIPMIFLMRDRKYIPCMGGSFYDFMQGKLKALPGELPTDFDLLSFIGTTYPDIRLKKIIELRGFDVVPPPYTFAIPAFWMGLLYDSASLDAAYGLALSIQKDEFVTWRHDLADKNIYRTKRNKDLINQLFLFAKSGLCNRNNEEEQYLEPLYELMQRGVSLAHDIRNDFHNMDLTKFVIKWSN
jgi:glutamate--cysteine ligase